MQIFFEGEVFLLDGFLTERIFCKEKIFQGVRLPDYILHWGNLPEYLHVTVFICCSLPLRINFTCEEVKGKFSREDFHQVGIV